MPQQQWVILSQNGANNHTGISTFFFIEKTWNYQYLIALIFGTILTHNDPLWQYLYIIVSPTYFERPLETFFHPLARSQKPMMIRFLTRCEGSHRGQTPGSTLACTVENMRSKWGSPFVTTRATSSSQWGLWPLPARWNGKKPKLTGSSAFILHCC